MIVMAIVGVLLAIAFTEYRGMQARGNDASAVGSLRSIAAAQWQFALTCGNMKYVDDAAGAGAGRCPSTGEAFLSPDLTAATAFEKSGYMFQMAAKPLEAVPPACNGAPVADGYAATADPVQPGITRELLSTASTPTGSCMWTRKRPSRGTSPRPARRRTAGRSSRLGFGL